MQFDVFISYAWTSDEHREWVHLLAAALRHMGFSIGIDEKVDYGNDLDDFMRKISESKHVLMIVDDNYVHRADNLPCSGVGIENGIIREEIGSKPENWLAPLLIRNEDARLPKWLCGKKRKYFDFRTQQKGERFPGAQQIDDLWRWLVGLPPNKEHAVSIAMLLKGAHRIEKVNALRSPGTWSCPQFSGQGVNFPYRDAPNQTIVLGAGRYSFSLSVSECDENSVYVYADYVKAVGLITDGTPYDEMDADSAYEYITPGRTITPKINQTFVLMNDDGILCSAVLRSVIREKNGVVYEKPRITFDYKVLLEE